MHIKTNLFTALLTSLVLTTAGSFPAVAQEGEPEDDKRVLFSISTEEEWTNPKVIQASYSKAHWERYYYAVPPNHSFFVELPSSVSESSDEFGTIEGEFSNGVTGVGDKHFEVYGSRKDPQSHKWEWVYIGKISPGSSRGGQFNFRSLSLGRDDYKWESFKFIYKRGANLSTGGIKSLRICSDRYNDKNIAPRELTVSNIDSASAIVSWSGSKYPFDQKSKYFVEVEGSFSSKKKFEIENTNHFYLSNLKPDCSYNVALKRKYDGDIGSRVVTYFSTAKLKSPYALANVFDTCNVVESEKKYADIHQLRGKDVVTFHLDRPASSFAFDFSKPSKEDTVSLSFGCYNENDEMLTKFTRNYSRRQLSGFYGYWGFDEYLPGGTVKVRLFNHCSDSLKINDYKFPVAQTWLYGKNIELAVDEDNKIRIDFNGNDPSLRAAQEPLTVDGKELTLHLALFQSEPDGNEAVQLFDRPLTVQEITEHRCFSGERMNPELLYTAYLYYTVGDECYDMVWKSFTRADVATGNETIPMAVDDVTVRCEERRVYITRPEAMTGLLQLTDFTGRHITGQRLQQATEASIDIDQPGNYIIRLILSDGVINRKISVR